MFISIPKEFFVPVLFSEDFKFNSDNNSMEYDSNYRNTKHNIKREKLFDLDYVRGESGITTEYLENLININDKKIEEQILNYIKSFIKYIEELKAANCLDSNQVNINTLINYYVKSFREVYDEYTELINMINTPIASSDKDGIIDKYMIKFEDIYNKSLEQLKCKKLNTDEIERILDEIFDDIRDILKEEIQNKNCDIINESKECKDGEVIRTEHNQSDKIYQKIDDQFVKMIKNKSK